MTNEGCMGNGRGTGQAHTCDSCTPETSAVLEVLNAHRMHYAYGDDAACLCGWAPTHMRAWHDEHRVHTAEMVAAALPHLLEIARNLPSQPPEATSNGLTASSRHPGTPEDTKPPQEGM